MAVQRHLYCIPKDIWQYKGIYIVFLRTYGSTKAFILYSYGHMAVQRHLFCIPKDIWQCKGMHIVFLRTYDSTKAFILYSHSQPGQDKICPITNLNR